jgi:hypothetical protein
LHLALKTTESILEGFSLLKPYFCQTDTPPNSSGGTGIVITGIQAQVKGRTGDGGKSSNPGVERGSF